MSQALHDTPQEFWQPPAANSQSLPPLENVCDGCSSEFMVGARFCHVCGTCRAAKGSPAPGFSRALEFLKPLEFQNVKNWLGLTLPAMIAFFAGLGCILGAIAVGMIFSAQTLADFQAIQLWRIEWLLAALVAFTAGILLKNSGAR